MYYTVRSEQNRAYAEIKGSELAPNLKIKGAPYTPYDNDAHLLSDRFSGFHLIPGTMGTS